MKTLILLALSLLVASTVLAQPIGEDDGPIGGAMVDGNSIGNAPIGGEDVYGGPVGNAPIDGPMVGGEAMGNAPIGGAMVDGAAIGQEEDDAAVGNQPLY